jgi:hypothetical protein
MQNNHALLAVISPRCGGAPRPVPPPQPSLSSSPFSLAIATRRAPFDTGPLVRVLVSSPRRNAMGEHLGIHRLLPLILVLPRLPALCRFVRVC